MGIINASAPIVRVTNQNVVNCNCASSATLVYLPHDISDDITIKKTDSSANAVTVTSFGGSPIEGATKQVETATTVGTVTVAGNAAVVVTSALLPNGAQTYAVPVPAGVTAVVAAAIRAFLVTRPEIVQNYVVSGSGATVVLTTIDYLANDTTLNIATATGTATGITTAATSVSTTAGVPVQLTTQNEYKTFRLTGNGWAVINAGGVNTTETLVHKTLTAPVLVNPATTVTINPHSYGSGTTAWTLSAAEILLPIHIVTLAGGAVDAIIPLTIRPYIFINTSGQALTVKAASGTGIVIASTKTAMVMSDGTNILRLTTDA